MSKFGDLIRGNSAPTPAPAAAPVVEPVVEELLVEESAVDEEEVAYKNDVSLHDMTKKELEEYGRTVGIELDRRRSKESLIQELENYLGSDS